ncbi:signal peptidase I [Nitrosopumilus sp.]|uniref:signal peptidase I n=1 Tax=Nitrosopumilus sp. TaxID=2024843 RepID=UPI0029315387|nr:signal peptidase I [Nitrosopumilus sp.]
MTKKSTSRGFIKDIIIVVIAIAVIFVSLQVVFGFGSNPFYVVASGSMIPELLIDDIIVVQGNIPFEEIEIGDIIVFNRPSDHNKVIVHRVVTILGDDPKTIRTKGDANSGSIPGTDFPITEEEYLGKTVAKIPQVGWFLKFIQPPVNYILIAIVIGIIIVKQMTKKKSEKEFTLYDPLDSEDQENNEEIADIDKIQKDSEYSTHTEKSKMADDGKNESEEPVKDDDKSSRENKKE